MAAIKYKSTRGGVSNVDFEDIVFSGYAPDGGLFVPERLPTIDAATLDSWVGLSLAQVSARILSLFVSPALRPHLPEICKKTFASFADPSDPVPIRALGDIYVCELFHGPTLAFKVCPCPVLALKASSAHCTRQDIGLGILAQLMERIRSQRPGQRRKVTVLVETSGDTGPAAVHAVMRHTRSIKVLCLFPRRSVTPQQARQLTTAMPKSANVRIYAADRNLEAQVIRAVCADAALVRDCGVCSMNSINLVRLLSQISYFFHAFLELELKRRRGTGTGTRGPSLQCVDFAVPTGAFGNSCAAAMAMAMGLPVRHLIPCVNENDIVHRTLARGDFSSLSRAYRITCAPAMDIEIPFNLERFFWLCFDGDCATVARVMRQFANFAPSKHKNDFAYSFEERERKCFERFVTRSFRVTDADIAQLVPAMLREHGYVVGPHGACSIFGALRAKAEIGDAVPMVALLTAHPAKFPDIIHGCVGDVARLSEAQRSELERRLTHAHLPRKGEPEEFIELKSDGVEDWIGAWAARIKHDIVQLHASDSRLQSKL